MPLSYSTISSGSSSSSVTSNDFIVNVGTSGYTTSSLSRDFPAGTYVVTSALSDSSYDIYLVASDGSSAGSVNAAAVQSSLTATKAFNKVLIYGSQSNDVYSFTYKYIFNLASDDTSTTTTGPRITSLSSSTLPNVNSSITVTGKNFASNVSASFIGTDNVTRSAKSVTRNSSTSLVVVRPDNMPIDYQPYSLVITNPGISNPTSTNAHISTNLNSGQGPTWTTSAGNLSTILVRNNFYSTTLSSTDPDAGGSITYSVVSGSLPSGISLNSSTGAITGTSSANFGIYNFTVRATDAGGNYVDRAFGIINNPLVDSDNFNRSTSGSLGSTTGSTFTWVATKGTWQADGSYATSSDSSSNNSMATITGATTNISNLQVDTLGSGGTGVSFWVTDANSWYALTTYYSSTSGTSTSCTGGNSGANAGGYSSACCGGYYTQQLTVNYIECCGTGVTFIRNTSAGCVGPTSAQINACNNNYGGYCGYSCDAPATYYYCSNTNVTTSYTNYLSNVRLIKNGSNLVDTTYSNNTSGYSTAGSVVISTSGNNITYSVYSGAGASGQLYSSSYTDSGAVKGNGVGIYKGNGGNLQGSSVDNFSVTLT